MDKISVTLPSETIVRLSNVVDESYDNRSEAVRDLVQKGFEYDELERENRRLQRQLAATNRRVDEHKQLQEYVEGQQELERRRARREERRAHAGILTKTKWALMGMPRKNEQDAANSENDL